MLQALYIFFKIIANKILTGQGNRESDRRKIKEDEGNRWKASAFIDDETFFLKNLIVSLLIITL